MRNPSETDDARATCVAGGKDGYVGRDGRAARGRGPRRVSDPAGRLLTDVPGPHLAEVGGIAYRELGDPGGRPVIFVHGYPESSYIWRDVMAGAADAGWRALAPDLPGFGDSPPDPPGTWEHQIEHLERFRDELELGPVALVVHDWGGLIGLRWACDHPQFVRALVISNSGFFPRAAGTTSPRRYGGPRRVSSWSRA